MNEKLNYFQAVGEAVGTERRVKLENGEWLYVNMVGGEIVLSTVYSEGVIDEEDICRPTVDQKLFKEWIVEPEKNDIFIYCVCDSDGTSCGFNKYPQKIAEDAHFQWDSGDSPVEFEEQNLFPKKEPVKCRIVPVEDDAV